LGRKPPFTSPDLANSYVLESRVCDADTGLLANERLKAMTAPGKEKS
jgi:hypothetical protein